MLNVKLLAEGARSPSVAYVGEDVGYDLYALEDLSIVPGQVVKARTGIAVEAYDAYHKPLGLLIRDRSSLASKGIITHGGVIDAGYRGEIVVILSYTGPTNTFYVIDAGDKIAQMVPIPVLTGNVQIVQELSDAARGERGFGSSGQ